jgi:hypothetical protein
MECTIYTAEFNIQIINCLLVLGYAVLEKKKCGLTLPTKWITGILEVYKQPMFFKNGKNIPYKYLTLQNQ